MDSQETLFWLRVTCMLFSLPSAFGRAVVYVVSHEVYLSVYSVYEWTMLLAVVKVEASARWEAPANSLAPNGCEEDLALATSTRALSPSCYSTAQRRSRVVAVEPEGVGPCGWTFLSTTIILPCLSDNLQAAFGATIFRRG